MIVATSRVFNFYAGPATLPLEVLEQVRDQLLDFRGTGMSVMEISHRAKPYMALQEETSQLLRELLAIPDRFKILFLQGGASLQFAMVPMNLLAPGEKADYLLTDDWSKKALKEAKLFGAPRAAYSSEDTGFDQVPQPGDRLELDPEARYLHLTSNNTIVGTQYRHFPQAGRVPLVADMSSDILSRRFDWEPFGLVYAGAQKNLGPSGVTVVVIRDDLLAGCRGGVTSMLSYPVHAQHESLYNTPPTFGVFVLHHVLKWAQQLGMEALEARNRRKAEALYAALDAHGELYRGHALPESRSWMNVTWRLADDALEKPFLAGAEERQLIGLKGHRSVGGFRASIYNAMPEEGVQALVEYLHAFAAQHP